MSDATRSWSSQFADGQSPVSNTKHVNRLQPGTVGRREPNPALSVIQSGNQVYVMFALLCKDKDGGGRGVFPGMRIDRIAVINMRSDRRMVKTIDASWWNV